MRVIRRASLAAVAALALGVGVLVAAPAYAAPVSTVIDGITYKADDSDIAAGATVTAFDGGTTTVMIPDSVEIDGDDYDVATIAQRVFRDMSLTSVTIGNNVSTIGNLAFQQNSLGSVTIPDSVTKIGQNAFGFTKLTDLTLGNSVTTIEYGAFSSNRLTSVTIPGSVSEVGLYAFVNNPDLTSVVFSGAAPTVTSASEQQSFDTSSGSLVLSYLSAYDASNVADGFTTPTWEGYDTQAIRDDVPHSYVSISKTVDASFVRVYDWELEKTGTVGEITVGDNGASADIDYVVTATPNGYTDDYYLLSGTITVTNEIVEPMSVTVADEPSIGVDASCTIVTAEGEPIGDLRLSANESVTLDYTCYFDGIPEDGTNTATVSWWGGDGSASVTEDVVFTQRDTSFKTVTIGDDHANPDDGFTELGTATWGSDQLSSRFDYTLTKENLPLNECTSVTNTAMIYEMERTADTTVEVCPEAAVVIPTPTPKPTPAPVVGDPAPSALAQTGSGLDGGFLAIAFLLALVGGGALALSRRPRIRLQRER